MDLIVPDVTPSAEEDASVSAITLNNIPDDLADRLRAQQDRLPEILELGLREWSATPPAFQWSAEVLEFLASLPAPEEIIALRPSDSLRDRVRALVQKSRAGALSQDEEDEWERYEFVEHLVRIAKISAREKLGIPPETDA
jgi:hypothetical protein